MLISILLAPPPTLPAFPSLTPSAKLLASIRGVIMSEGIYDIDLLLQSFPTYKDWFIANTFGDCDSYPGVDTSAYELREGAERIRWLILHSKGDTLVDVLQSQKMIARLQSFDSINRREDGVEVENYLELTKDHNDVLMEDKYHEIVNSFITFTEEINGGSVA